MVPGTRSSGWCTLDVAYLDPFAPLQKEYSVNLGRVHALPQRRTRGRRRVKSRKGWKKSWSPSKARAAIMRPVAAASDSPTNEYPPDSSPTRVAGKPQEDRHHIISCLATPISCDLLAGVPGACLRGSNGMSPVPSMRIPRVVQPPSPGGEAVARTPEGATVSRPRPKSAATRRRPDLNTAPVRRAGLSSMKGDAKQQHVHVHWGTSIRSWSPSSARAKTSPLAAMPRPSTPSPAQLSARLARARALSATPPRSDSWVLLRVGTLS